MLKAHGVKRLTDLGFRNRDITRSTIARPWSGHSATPTSDNEHMKALGGLRHPREDSPNRVGATSRSAAMPTTCRRLEFESALVALAGTAAHEASRSTCAEAAPWPLSPLPDFGCPDSAGLSGGAHHERDQVLPTHDDVICEGGRASVTYPAGAQDNCFRAVLQVAAFVSLSMIPPDLRPSSPV